MDGHKLQKLFEKLALNELSKSSQFQLIDKDCGCVINFGT